MTDSETQSSPDPSIGSGYGGALPEALATIARRREAAEHPTVWRQGGSQGTEGCTIYQGPRFVGSVRHPEDAAFLVEAANTAGVDLGPAITLKVFERLPALVAQTRRGRGLSPRAAAVQIGLAHGTLNRIERGEPFNSRAVPLILRWLAAS